MSYSGQTPQDRVPSHLGAGGRGAWGLERLEDLFWACRQKLEVKMKSSRELTVDSLSFARKKKNLREICVTTYFCRLFHDSNGGGRGHPSKRPCPGHAS